MLTTSTQCKLHNASKISTKYQECVNIMSTQCASAAIGSINGTIYKYDVNPMSTHYQPSINKVSTLRQQSQHSINNVSTLCQQSQQCVNVSTLHTYVNKVNNHVSTLYVNKVNNVSTLCQQYLHTMSTKLTKCQHHICQQSQQFVNTT